MLLCKAAVTLTPIALMSLSWPPKVCLHWASLMSHSLAVKSHAPEMKNLKSGDTASDMQSPWCPAKIVFWVPVSMSHKTLKKKLARKHYFIGTCPNACLILCNGCVNLTMCSLQSWWWSQSRWGSGSRRGNLPIKWQTHTHKLVITWERITEPRAAENRWSIQKS